MNFLDMSMEKIYIVLTTLETTGIPTPICRFTFSDKRIVVYGAGIYHDFTNWFLKTDHPTGPWPSKSFDSLIERDEHNLSVEYKDVVSISFSEENVREGPARLVLHFSFKKGADRETRHYFISEAQLRDMKLSLNSVSDASEKINFSTTQHEFG